MDILTVFLNKVAYRFPKGYPDINDEQDMLLLENILLEKGINLREEDSTLDNFIRQKLGEIPEVNGKYTLKPGPLTLNSKDVENFKKLYYLSPSKGFGYGEIALYWLFQFSGTPSKSNQGDEQPDLLIGGIPVEVKSYPTSRTALGKFKRDKEFRIILSRLFGLHNLTSVVEDNVRDFSSEVNFNLDTIRDAYKNVIELDKVMSEVNITSYPFLKNIQKEINYLLSLDSNKTPEDLAKAVIAKCFTKKLQAKPGEGGYVANIKPKDLTDIYLYQLPENIEEFIKELSYDEAKKALTTQSAEFSVDFSIFK